MATRHYHNRTRSQELSFLHDVSELLAETGKQKQKPSGSVRRAYRLLQRNGG